MREDVVTDGGDAAKVLSNAPRSADGFLHRAQGGGIVADLTSLTLKAALDGMAAKAFSAEELARAHIDAIESANPHLNAYVAETPEQAIEMANASDERRARGEAGPLEGASLGIKDLYCTDGVATDGLLHHPARASSRPTSRPSPPTRGATGR